jgi:hypothetical protein
MPLFLLQKPADAEIRSRFQRRLMAVFEHKALTSTERATVGLLPEKSATAGDGRNGDKSHRGRVLHC